MKQIVYQGTFPEVTIEHPKLGTYKCKRGESVEVPESLAAELTAPTVRQKVTIDGKTTEETLQRASQDWRIATETAPKKQKE